MSGSIKNRNSIVLIIILLFFSLIPTVNSATSDDAIKGSMTEEKYKEKYSELNQQQNEAWNTKHNFRPETNVRRVDTLDDFIKAYENNDVSKIILENDIRDTTTTGRSYRRTESIEIDGQGYLLELVHSSLNVDDLMKLSDFTKKFSDVPVFHMHDIQIANNKGYGEKEGNLSNAWSFINGRGEWGAGSGSGLARGERGLWRYRIGNVYTPYDTSKTTDNQRVGGRLIGGNNGEISVWGYNKIVTGAENFYTGGMIYEPYTYYRGEIADYNYSTIWFILNPVSVTNADNKNNITGDQKFIIGDNSFVYLHNTNTGKSFPAIYEHYKLIDVGENATYNANVSGTAVSFNESDAQFVARKNSKVNLLSRASGAPTISLIHSNSTHSTGSTTPPNNTSYTINEDAEFYVVGTNSNAYQGVVNYGYDGYSNRVSGKLIMNSPQAFDIRNMGKNNFLGQGDASDLFSVTNSDISLWSKGSDLDGFPQIDTNNVQTFSVVPTGTNGDITTTDSKLRAYIRTNYQRISGFNAAPELLWEAVTDADATQKARVLLGYVPAGGSNPFDPNGDAIVVPVYADSNRVVEADLIDTLGNTFSSKTQADGYLYWNESDHAIKGFQKANENISGKPFRLDSSNNRYREGEEASTVVVDVTPPEPAKVTSGVTTVSKKLTGTAEPFSKVTVTINDVNQTDMVTTANAQGNWELVVPSDRLKKNDKVQIFLEDNALEIKSDQAYANANGLAYLPADRIPVTNSATGNKNPKADLKYSDTTFKAATIVIVADIAPPTPKIDKIARSLTTDGKENQIPQTESGNAKPEEWQGTITKVNNTLSYRIAVQIPGTMGSEVEKVLYNAKITDQIPENLTFNKEDVKVWKYKKGDATTGLPIRYENDVIDSNGKHQFNMGDIDLVSSEATLLNDAIVNYDETSRLLTVGIGETTEIIGDKYGYNGSNEYGYLLPGDKIVMEFPTTVTSKAAKTTIKNTATVSGFSAEEVSEVPLVYKEISATSTETINPGGVVTGELVLVSAPDTLNFGTTNLIDYNKAVGSDKTNIDQPLIVKDTLKDKNWKVTVNLLTDLSYKDGADLYELPNSLYVRYKGENTPLTLHSPTTIYESDIASMPNDKEEFNISDSWSKELDKDGIKMKASKVPTAATYSGDLEWSLTNTQ